MSQLVVPVQRSCYIADIAGLVRLDIINSRQFHTKSLNVVNKSVCIPFIIFNLHYLEQLSTRIR